MLMALQTLLERVGVNPEGSPAQATRVFAIVASGGALGSIAGPLLTRLLVKALGLSGLLLLSAALMCVGISVYAQGRWLG